MYYANCKWYVDMGEHNKPLCKKRGYRPAECELCPTRVASLEAENAKLRELCLDAHEWMDRALYDGSARRHEYESITECMRELGVEVDE